MRKIVQIVVQQAGMDETWDGEPNRIHQGLFALCQDGTLWFRGSGATVWEPIPPIPQDQPPAKEAE